MANLLERRIESEPATLAGFELLTLEAAPWPMVFAAADERVEGRLYRDLDAADYARLDRYEGVAEGLYRRDVAAAKAGRTGSEPEPAHVYVPTEKTLRRLGAL